MSIPKSRAAFFWISPIQFGTFDAPPQAAIFALQLSDTPIRGFRFVFDLHALTQCRRIEIATFQLPPPRRDLRRIDAFAAKNRALLARCRRFDCFEDANLSRRRKCAAAWILRTVSDDVGGLPLVLVIMVCSPLPRFELTGLESVVSDHVDRWGSASFGKSTKTKLVEAPASQ